MFLNTNAQLGLNDIVSKNYSIVKSYVELRLLQEKELKEFKEIQKVEYLDFMEAQAGKFTSVSFRRIDNGFKIFNEMIKRIPEPTEETTQLMYDFIVDTIGRSHEKDYYYDAEQSIKDYYKFRLKQKSKLKKFRDAQKAVLKQNREFLIGEALSPALLDNIYKHIKLTMKNIEDLGFEETPELQGSIEFLTLEIYKESKCTLIK